MNGYFRVMTLADVVGQNRAIDALRAALKKGSVHHAYLFAGPDGVGKELTAFGLAQALLCRERPGEGCGACAVCGRVQRRNHPDVMWVMPEDELVSRGLAGRADFANTPSREIKVEQIRALQERLALRALEGTHKLALIASAQQLNTQAQNALLKTLEEPPAGAVLVLIASAPDKLLPTIRSRCSRVSFGPLPADRVAARVEKERGLDPATARMVAMISGGSLGRALELDVEGLGARKGVIEAFEQVKLDDARTVLRFADEFGGSREDAEDALRILAIWFRDVAVARAGGGSLVNADLEALARKSAERIDEPTLHRRYGVLDQAAQAIGRNGAPRLQLERMLIEMGDA